MRAPQPQRTTVRDERWINEFIPLSSPDQISQERGISVHSQLSRTKFARHILLLRRRFENTIGKRVTSILIVVLYNVIFYSVIFSSLLIPVRYVFSPHHKLCSCTFLLLLTFFSPSRSSSSPPPLTTTSDCPSHFQLFSSSMILCSSSSSGRAPLIWRNEHEDGGPRIPFEQRRGPNGRQGKPATAC